MLAVHPLFNEAWAEKAVAFQKLRTPILVYASFSDHELHTPGSFRAYLDAGA